MNKKVTQILEQKNIRPTAMRVLVYKTLAKHETAQSLSHIEEQLETADRTTLYRTIKTFEEQGVVHSIDDGTGITKYALCAPYCTHEEHHDLHLHFHCNICEETTCLTDFKIPPISLPDSFIAQDVNLLVKGVCEKCNM